VCDPDWVGDEMVEARDIEGARKGGRRGGKQLKFWIGGLIILATVGYLIYAAARGSTAYYVTIAELAGQGSSAQSVRVVGNVIGESILWEPRDLRLQFEITDGNGLLPVSYSGARPDMFRDGAEVVVEGKLSPDGTFEARTMLLKCPSKYEEAQ
jgi:cytochrome c-type biogenesis protein CcmE